LILPCLETPEGFNSTLELFIFPGLQQNGLDPLKTFRNNFREAKKIRYFLTDRLLHFLNPQQLFLIRNKMQEQFFKLNLKKISRSHLEATYFFYL